MRTLLLIFALVCLPHRAIAIQLSHFWPDFIPPPNGVKLSIHSDFPVWLKICDANEQGVFRAVIFEGCGNLTIPLANSLFPRKKNCANLNLSALNCIKYVAFEDSFQTKAVFVTDDFLVSSNVSGYGTPNICQRVVPRDKDASPTQHTASFCGRENAFEFMFENNPWSMLVHSDSEALTRAICGILRVVKRHLRSGRGVSSVTESQEYKDDTYQTQPERFVSVVSHSPLSSEVATPYRKILLLIFGFGGLIAAALNSAVNPDRERRRDSLPVIYLSAVFIVAVLTW